MDAGIHPDNIIVWGLRGHSMPITELAPKIIEVAKKEGCIAIIIDPLYKVLKGDENSNSDIAEMSKGFDRIAQETKCSVIYAHHFAKGYAGDKQSIDRGSGAGTFSRDPDAILTMTQLDVDSESATAWRIEYTLREFPNKKSTDMWWVYPIHKLDPKLAMYDVVSQKTAQQKIQKRIAKKQTIDIVRDVVESVPKVDDEGGFTTTDFIAEYELIEKVGSRNTAEKRLKDAGFIKTTETNGKPGIWHKK
jgi:RecA-family ATPase